MWAFHLHLAINIITLFQPLHHHQGLVQQVRNLPFVAGTACAYGLSKEQALQSVTLDAAKILGVDKWIGSLEVDKVASIVVSDGDLLDMKTNKVVLAYIAGKSVNLVNHQQLLYEKYKAKYGIK